MARAVLVRYAALLKMAAAATTPTALRSTLLISAFTMGSRVLGLVREQLFAALLGAGFYADAFVAAFRIPNLLRDLFAEGALSAAFVPTFAKVEQEQGRSAAHELANRVSGALCIVVGAIVALGAVFSRQIVWALASGYASVPGKLELTSELARLMMPFLLVVSLSAVTMGMLNARGRFGAPALAPALFNVVAIAVGFGLWLAGAPPRTAVLGWSIGTLMGGVAQLVVQLPSLAHDGFFLRPRFVGTWRDPALRRIAMLMTPAVVGLSATQANIFINTQFASTEAGANAWLNYAFRLMYLPIGIFGVAIATVTATGLARRAAARDYAGLLASLAQGLRHVAVLTVPSTVGLVLLAEPIIGLLYEHGRFTVADTRATALALVGYAVGLYAYSGVKVTAPAFYALERSRVPLLGSAAAVSVNLVLNLFAYARLGYVGLALGTSLGAVVNLLVLQLALARVTPGFSMPPWRGQLAKVALASLAMGAVVWGADQGALAALRHVSLPHTLSLALRVVGGLGLGAASYVLACRLLHVAEINELLAIVRRRRDQGFAGASGA